MLITACGKAAEYDHDHEHEGHDHEQHDEHEHDHDQDEANENHDGLIELSDAEAARFKIVTDVAQNGNIAEMIVLPGIVTGTQDGQVTITASKSGKLTLSSGIREGQSVGKGRTVATIAGVGVSGGDQDAANTERLRAIEAEIQRVKPLVDEGIVTRKGYNALIAQANELRRLTSTSGAAGTLTSPVNGIVTQVVATSGTYVNPGDIVAVIQGGTSGGKMVKIDIPQRLAARLSHIRSAVVKTADGTTLSLPHNSTAPSAGTVSGYIPAYFGPVNSDVLINGTTVEAGLIVGSNEKPLTVPAECISEQEGVYSVFVKTGAGHYRRVPVTIGSTDGRLTEITGGIHPTDSIVTSGSIFIRLAETRANAPQGHTHNH